MMQAIINIIAKYIFVVAAVVHLHVYVQVATNTELVLEDSVHLGNLSRPVVGYCIDSDAPLPTSGTHVRAINTPLNPTFT